MGSGVDKRSLELTIYDVLLESASIAEARQRNQRSASARSWAPSPLKSAT